uniref:GNAT family N-acetyltransferase n=1 Tax=Thaumasiovibrio occultus TaxID=1891184 RepID=UPI000B35C89F|nr:GNAT family protein [Thaumasiovibrio occultus]
MNITMHLRTRRLVIRAATQMDLPKLYSYLSCGETSQFLPTSDVSLDGVKTLIDKPYPHTFVITNIHGKIVGHLLFHLWHEKHTYKLGWVIAPEYRGKGFATEAASAVMDFGFHDLNAHRIIATAQPENVASWRLMEKIGMRREGHFIQCIARADGTWWDEYFYAALKSSWQVPEGVFSGY